MRDYLQASIIVALFLSAHLARVLLPGSYCIIPNTTVVRRAPEKQAPFLPPPVSPSLGLPPSYQVPLLRGGNKTLPEDSTRWPARLPEGLLASFLKNQQIETTHSPRGPKSVVWGTVTLQESIYSRRWRARPESKSQVGVGGGQDPWLLGTPTSASHTPMLNSS